MYKPVKKTAIYNIPVDSSKHEIHVCLITIVIFVLNRMTQIHLAVKEHFYL